MEKLHTSKTFLKMAGGRMHTLHPTPGHKLQKPSSVFQSLGKISFVFFTKRQSQKGTMPLKHASGYI